MRGASQRPAGTLPVTRSLDADAPLNVSWIGGDEPCACCVGKDAIDTKYRIGSGDSGTLKKFKSYGKLLKERGYRPVLLMVREDNLAAAMTACATGGWTVLQGQATFDYIKELSDFDLRAWLESCKNSGEFFIHRA